MVGSANDDEILPYLGVPDYVVSQSKGKKFNPMSFFSMLDPPCSLLLAAMVQQP
jgi:hypothetical protein